MKQLCTEMKVMDTDYCPQLLASIEQLGALHVCHAEIEISDEAEIYRGEGGSRKLGSRENSKGSPFA